MVWVFIGLACIFLVAAIIAFVQLRKKQRMGDVVPARQDSAAPERMQLLSRSGGFMTPQMCVYLDVQTGVEYLVVNSGSGVAVTPLIARKFDRE